MAGGHAPPMSSLRLFIYKPAVPAYTLPYASFSTKDILGQAPRERRIHILSS